MKRKDLGSLSYLQDYSSSESEEEIPTSKLRKRLPPPSLPLYKEPRSITRKPEINDGDIKKIRNFPHEPGNWATYVSIPISQNDQLRDFLNDLLVLHPELELSTAEDFHVSVTRTVVLRHHWIKDFIESVNAVLEKVKPFLINLTGFKVYLNENKTRTFIGLKVNEGVKDLIEIVKVLDECLAHYNLPPFYKPASFHMSILWCVGDKADELRKYLNDLPKHFEEFNLCLKVSNLRCICGNKTFTFNFK